MDHQYHGEQQDLHYPDGRFNEKGCLPAWGGVLKLTPFTWKLPSIWIQGFFSLCLKAWKICLLVEGPL
jgi:hypothetical protein